MVGYFLVRKFAPEAGGSGIPEIEGALEELRPVRWWRVLPVKFIGGMGTLGAGMVLGREGPTVQIGGNLGRMVLDVFRMRSAEARHTLLATGAAAGLSAAFNAPLAGILFIIEEMRPQFRYNLISIKAVFTGVIMSSIVFRIFNGEAPIIEVGKLSDAPVNTLWLYLILGIIFGCVGPVFNSLVLRTQDMFQRFHGGEIKKSRQAADLTLFLSPRQVILASGYCCSSLLPGLSRRCFAFLPARRGAFSPRCWRWERCLVRPSVWRRQCFSRSITWRPVPLRLPGWGR